MSRDEQRLWTKVCDEFERLRDEAAEFGCGSRFDRLVARTRQANVSIWEWKDLLDEIAEQISLEADYSGRGEQPVRVALGSRPAFVNTRFACPAGLCGDYAAGSPLSGPPRCLLLDREMTPMP
jgi:hypothetical protein